VGAMVTDPVTSAMSSASSFGSARKFESVATIVKGGVRASSVRPQPKRMVTSSAALGDVQLVELEGEHHVGVESRVHGEERRAHVVGRLVVEEVEASRPM